MASNIWSRIAEAEAARGKSPQGGAPGAKPATSSHQPSAGLNYDDIDPAELATEAALMHTPLSEQPNPPPAIPWNRVGDFQKRLHQTQPQPAQPTPRTVPLDQFLKEHPARGPSSSQERIAPNGPDSGSDMSVGNGGSDGQGGMVNPGGQPGMGYRIVSRPGQPPQYVPVNGPQPEAAPTPSAPGQKASLGAPRKSHVEMQRVPNPKSPTGWSWSVNQVFDDGKP